MSASALQIVGIAGSLRHASFNRKLLEAAASIVPDGVRLATQMDLANVPLYNEDLEQSSPGPPAAVLRLAKEIADADGFLIATPEYNQSLPGVLKNAIDWLTRPAVGAVLEGKPVAIMGVTAGRWGTRLAQSALRHTLYAAEARVLPAPSLFLANAARLFDPAGRLIDVDASRGLRSLLESFVSWIRSCQ